MLKNHNKKPEALPAIFKPIWSHQIKSPDKVAFAKKITTNCEYRYFYVVLTRFILLRVTLIIENIDSKAYLKKEETIRDTLVNDGRGKNDTWGIIQAYHNTRVISQ